jgi:hypothetical protein
LRKQQWQRCLEPQPDFSCGLAGAELPAKRTIQQQGLHTSAAMEASNSALSAVSAFASEMPRWTSAQTSTMSSSGTQHIGRRQPTQGQGPADREGLFQVGDRQQGCAGHGQHGRQEVISGNVVAEQDQRCNAGQADDRGHRKDEETGKLNEAPGQFQVTGDDVGWQESGWMFR